MTNSTISQKLALIQLADSFFPSGSYTLSHGLETILQGDRLSPGEILTWLRILIINKVATSDLVAVIQTHQADADVVTLRSIANQLYAHTLIEVTRNAQSQSGRALLTVAQATWQAPVLEKIEQERIQGSFHCLHPVIFGLVGQIAGLDSTDTALAFVHGLVTGILGAAIRLGSLGHLQAQQILLELAPVLEQAIALAFTLDINEIYSHTPAIDIAQMRHTRLSTRLFAS